MLPLNSTFNEINSRTYIMNATAMDKKWFIYIVDHHEGPFTVAEIQDGIAQGKLPATGFVWAQGMVDWLPMNQVAEFHPRADILNTPPVPAGPPDESARPVEEKTKTTHIEIGDIDKRDVSKPRIYARPAGSGGSSLTDAEFAAATGLAPQKKSILNSGAAKALLILVALGSFSYGLQKAGLLAVWIDRAKDLMAGFPQIPDIEKEDYEILKKAAKTPMTSGPSVAIVLSKADPLSPQFYVGSNLSDGAVLEVFAEGVGNTLLNTMSFSGKIQASLQKGVGKTQALRYPDGKAIPRGEYTLYVMEAPQGQPEKVMKELSTLAVVARQLPTNLPQDRRIVYSKRLFIGQKDSSYFTRLKEFHDKIGQKAAQELIELKQIMQTVESQFQTTVAIYDRLKRQMIRDPQMKEWAKFNQTWRSIEGQIKSRLSSITRESLANDYYYGEYYTGVNQASSIVSDLHQTQEMLFQMKATAGSLEPKVTAYRTDFDAQFNAVRSAIDQVSAASADPNGFPPKAAVPPVQMTAPSVEISAEAPPPPQPVAPQGGRPAVQPPSKFVTPQNPTRVPPRGVAPRR